MRNIITISYFVLFIIATIVDIKLIDSDKFLEWKDGENIFLASLMIVSPFSFGLIQIFILFYLILRKIRGKINHD